MDLLHKIPTELIYVVMAAVGGIARYLQSYLSEGEFAWHHLLAHTFVSAFSGYMFYQFAFNILHLGQGSLPVVAGLGGWMGVEALKLLETLIRKHFVK